MSFDVEFRGRSQTTAPAESIEIKTFLSHRPNYDVGGESLVYQREATGVHGVWDFPAIEDHSDDPDAPVAVLSINFLRPGFFVRELSREIQEVQRFFKLTIHDPQSGLDHLPDTGGKAILASYMHHAGRAARAFASHPDGSRPECLPRAKLEAAWEWKDTRDQLQATLGEDIFVPTIMLARRDEGLALTAIWSDGIPILMPKVDLVLVHRDQTAPKQGLLRRRHAMIEVLAHDDFAALFANDATPSDAAPSAMAYGLFDPVGLRNHLTQRPLGSALRFDDPAWRSLVDFIPMDSVIDAEFLDPSPQALS
jgi:hypothetical protein